MLDVLVTQHSKWTARRLHRALFGQSLIDFSGESWTCLTNQSTTSKISNRCQHLKHTPQTHILSKFTSQFTHTDKTTKPIDMSHDDEWSACSEQDFSDESSESESFDERVELGPIKSQHLFKRLPKAFKAASEDFSQISNQDSVATANQTTEFYIGSP